MTEAKLTPKELRLLDAERARGIPYPDDIFAWRAAHAAELAQMPGRGARSRARIRGLVLNPDKGNRESPAVQVRLPGFPRARGVTAGMCYVRVR